MSVKIQLKRDTTSNWQTVNPVLARGELGIEYDNTNTNQVIGIKVGNGTSSWNDLGYTVNVALGTMSDSDILAKILNVDGSGSGLDADLLDGHDSTYFAPQSDTYTKAETDQKIADLVNSAPETLDTLNELAQALGDDPNFATTMTNELANKLGKTEKAADSELLDGYDSSVTAAASSIPVSDTNGTLNAWITSIDGGTAAT